MKHQYSTFSIQHKSKEAKKFMACLSESEYCRFVGSMWQANHERWPQFGLVWDRDSTYADTVLEFMWKFRKLHHYFLAPGIADFCAGSVKEFSPDYCKPLPECDAIDPPANPSPWVVVVGDDKMMRGGFAIHFPTSERNRSIIVLPDAVIPHPNGKAYFRYYFAASDGVDTVLMQRENQNAFWDGVDDGAAWIARLIFGLSLYMDAFPDAVVAASGEDVKHIGYYSGQRSTVTPNEIVDEERRHGVSPHWRRGHFRVLASERFTRKQGKTVYVRGTFVKGKAFAVLDDAPPCNANTVITETSKQRGLWNCWI